MPFRLSQPNRHLATLVRVAMVVAIGDWLTKAVAARFVGAEAIIFTEKLRFAVVHNDGSAFGLSAGSYTWQLNLALTLGAILLMIPVARDLARIDDAAPRALGLIVGGAVGNLASLVLGPPGVVDFISVSAGSHSELVLNVADVAAYIGLAMMLRTGYLIVAEIRHSARVTRDTTVRHWATVRTRQVADREVPRNVPMADLILPQNEVVLSREAPLGEVIVKEPEVVVSEAAPLADLLLPQNQIMIPRPESVRRAERAEVVYPDPKVIDIRPHLTYGRAEGRGQRAEGFRAD